MLEKELKIKHMAVIGIVLVVITALFTGLGTLAYFSATQTSGTNLLETGTIEFSVDGQDPWNATFNETLDDAKPGLVRWANVTIENTGKNPADLWVKIFNVTTGDINLTTAEKIEDPDGTIHDIDTVTRYSLYVDGNQEISYAEDFTISDGAHNLAGATTGINDTYIYLGNLDTGQGWPVNQSFLLDHNVTNWAQADYMNFQIEFYAQQSQGDPQPPAPTPELAGHGRT